MAKTLVRKRKRFPYLPIKSGTGLQANRKKNVVSVAVDLASYDDFYNFDLKTQNLRHLTTDNIKK